MNLILILVWWAAVVLGDIQEAIKAAQEVSSHTGSVLLPPTMAALPEEAAWSMVYAEGGAVAVIAVIAVTVLWRLFARILEETRSQNKELMAAQTTAIGSLGAAVQRVEGAVRLSDANNTHALTRLSDTVQTTIVRLDKHETKLEQHHESILHHSSRISVLESRRTPPSTPVGG